jgi:putative OPT family oligopeptide transporter
LLIAQMSPGQIWARYVRYIGAGAVAAAGIITVAKSLPTMAGAMAAVARGLKRHRHDAPGAPNGADGAVSRAASGGAMPNTERDLPGGFVVIALAGVIAVAALVPGVFAGQMGLAQRAVCAAGVTVFGILFVAVAARIVGIVGVTSQPTSGITLVTLLGVASMFAAAGWTSPAARAAVLTVGTIVAVAASKAGDISQDLKTGWLVGATPARQQAGQLIGAAFACWAVAGTVMLLGGAYTFGSQEMPAPQATLMKTIIEGVLAGDLPWGIVATGVGVTLSAILCGVSGLAFAIGVYLPLASMAPIYIGGCVRAMVERGGARSRDGLGDPGILAASGLVAGEGLAGVLVAALVASGIAPKSMEPRLGAGLAHAGAFVLIAAVCFFLLAAGRSARRGTRAA